LILYTLGEEPKRYGELKKLIPDITEKMLIEKLKELQSSGFVTRKDFKTIPPKVVYTITDL
jgi:DNA-binding HxlR family transcriptional regulator